MLFEPDLFASPFGYEHEFEFGLDSLLDGVERALLETAAFRSALMPGSPAEATG